MSRPQRRRDDEIAALLASEQIEGLAVLGTFDPARAGIAPEIGALCDRLAPRSIHEEWMLRETHRVMVLTRLLARGGMPELRRVRATTDGALPGPLQDMLDKALGGQGLDVEEATGDELVAALHVTKWLTAAAGLSRAGRLLPTGFDRELIEGRLALNEVLRPLLDITADGFVGREDELSQLNAFAADDSRRANAAHRPVMVVYGTGGVGKSTLVAHFVLDLARRSAAAGSPRPWAYLDLDRPSLAAATPQVLLADVISQLAAQAPEAARYLHSLRRRLREGSRGEGLESVSYEAWRIGLDELAMILEGSFGGLLVIVLDTYEVAQRAGPYVESRISELFDVFSRRLPNFRLVVSGRAPATAYLVTGFETPEIKVREFDTLTALAVLRHLYQRTAGESATALDDALAASIVAAVGGSPLTLRLAARVLHDQGAAAVADAARHAQTLDRVRTEFVRGFLYHRILAHVTGETPEQTGLVRTVARACVALRVVTPDVVDAAVLPVLDLHADAAMLVARMAADPALGYTEGDRLRLREDLRTPALAALGYEDPGLVTSLHRACVRYYNEHPTLPDAETERIYHALAVGDDFHAVAGSADEGVLRAIVDARMTLPEPNRQALDLALADPLRLDRDREAREEEARVEAHARAELQRSDYVAALHWLDSVAEPVAGTTLHALRVDVCEAQGDLARAADAAAADVRSAAVAGDPYRYCAALVRHALLVERLGDPVGAARILDETPNVSWFAGQTALQVQLVLQRIALLDRAGIDDDRWLASLDARALLTRLDPSVSNQDTALVRLLAATLGRDEPALVVEAVRFLGLGLNDNSTYTLALGDALAEWDASRPQPGELLRTAGVPAHGTSRDELRQQWLNAIAGAGTQAGTILGEALVRANPPPPVVEALRTIYLWWGINPEPAPVIGEEDRDLLNQPLDFTQPRLQSLEQALRDAYPKVEDLIVLAGTAGLDPTFINWQQSGAFLIREILQWASSQNLLGNLVQAALDDHASASFHSEIRNSIGAITHLVERRLAGEDA